MATEIVEYSKTEAALADLAHRYKGVVFDISTKEGMQEARRGRAEIRGYRTSLEAERVRIKEPALKRCQLIDSEANRLKRELEALEKPIDQQITKEEDRKVAERMAAVRAEEERLAAEERAKKEAEESRLAAERAEIARQRAALEVAERERLEKEKASRLAIEAEERAARQRIEAARLEAVEKEEAARKVRQAEEDRLRAEQKRINDEIERLAQEKAAKERAEARAKAEEERKIREAEEAKAREIKRQETELLDARAMLETFHKRFGHLVEFAPLIKWINQYLAHGRKAA